MKFRISLVVILTVVATATEAQSIFLPLAGYRDPDGKASGRNREGVYWSGRHGGGEGLVWHLYIKGNSAKTNPQGFPHEAYSVRCVKDIPGQRLR